MKVRHFLVAAWAAAILAGTSFGALAGHSKNISKGEASSRLEVTATAIPGDARCHIGDRGCKQPQSTVEVEASGKAKATGNSGAEYSAGGGGLAVQADVESPVDLNGSAAAAFGGVSGSACAGKGCN